MLARKIRRIFWRKFRRAAAIAALLMSPFPLTAADRWAKAQALRIIAFDASAELELKNAYFATSSPRFLLEAAQAAFDQGHFAAGMAYARIILPSFESRQYPMRRLRCGRLCTRCLTRPRCAAKPREMISIPCLRLD